MMGEGKSQYILPYYILMCAFAAYGLVTLFDRIRAKRPAPVPAPDGASASGDPRGKNE
ncbi:MAG: hypothetical protein II771_06430 [Clostridia bacterium]|nr:hypothetical protein [Clostridia bacterium]